MWKRLAWLAVLVVIALLPVAAVAYTKLFYSMSYRSDYRKVEVTITPIPEPMVTAKPTEIPLVEIPLESTLTPEPTPTPEVPEQITTLTDLSTTPAELL